LPKLMVNY